MNTSSFTGVWRAQGADGADPGRAHVLMIQQKGNAVMATDTHLRGKMRGVLVAAPLGVAVKGRFLREDGTTGTFAWYLDNTGTRFHGLWAAGGRKGSWSGVKQGNNIPADLGAFLAQRNGNTRMNGFGGLGMSFTDTLKQSGKRILSAGEQAVTGTVNAVKTRAEKEAEALLKQGKKKVEGVVDKVTGAIPSFPSGGGEASTPTPDTSAAGSNKVLKIAIIGGTVALVIGILAMMRRK